MDENGFWRLVDEARGAEPVDEATLTRLRERLDELSAADTLAALTHFDQARHRAYTWDLWAAGYLVCGGMGDDSFHDFRQWLIAQGRDVYERVLADPDTLADVSTDEEEIDSGVGELYGYEFTTALERKGVPVPPGGGDNAEPAGEEFGEDDDDWFAARFPRLWAAVRD